MESNNKYNILHVITRLPVGGVENMLLKVVNGYDKQRFNPVICCIKEGGTTSDKLINQGHKVYVLNRMKGHGFDPGAVKSIYHIIKEEKIQILRTHQYHANFYGRLAGIFAKVPIIIPSFHNLYRSPNRPKLHRRIFNHLLAYFSDVLIAVSEAIAMDMIKYDRINPDKIKVIYNGVDYKYFTNTVSRKEARMMLELPADDLIIGSVGRLTEQKNHRQLIEAASGLKDVSVVIAGDGPLMEELRHKSERSRVKCIFLGRLHYDRVPVFLRAIDFFCFPSLWEGLPSALVEAMSAGLPIVASDIAPVREVVDNTGILVPPEDAVAISRALKELIDDSVLKNKLGKSARKRAELFLITNTVHDYENLFDKLLNAKVPGHAA